jgi:hypothetical protein
MDNVALTFHTLGLPQVVILIPKRLGGAYYQIGTITAGRVSTRGGGGVQIKQGCQTECQMEC